jgi:hypothetical protein
MYVVEWGRLDMAKRRVDILLRDLVREAIGLEGMLWEWGVLDEEPRVMIEDPYSRKVDRVVPTKMEPNITSLKLKAMERPADAKADIDSALKKGDGSYEKAVEFLDREPGEDEMSARTLRRLHYDLEGGADRALDKKDKFSQETEEEREERRKKMRGLKRAHRGSKSTQKYK